MKDERINYTHFEKWKKLTGITNVELKNSARRNCDTKITNEEIGRRLNSGRPFPGEVILAWQKAYGWRQDETGYYLMNGELNDNKPLDKYTVEELWSELGRRITA